MLCKLEKDNKTLNLIKLYYSILEENDLKNCFKCEQFLQKEEIELHLKLNNPPSEIEGKIEWVEKYAKPMRDYFTTMKVICLIISLGNIELTDDNIKKIIDNYNKNRSCLNLED